MILVGVWLIRWANRNNMAGQIAGATAEAAVKAMRKGASHEMPAGLNGKPGDGSSVPAAPARSKKIAGFGLRNAMSQLFGVTGFIMAVVGLMLTILGAFYS
jgi:hypothetical protein